MNITRKDSSLSVTKSKPEAFFMMILSMFLILGCLSLFALPIYFDKSNNKSHRDLLLATAVVLFIIAAIYQVRSFIKEINYEIKFLDGHLVINGFDHGPVKYISVMVRSSTNRFGAKVYTIHIKPASGKHINLAENYISQKEAQSILNYMENIEGLKIEKRHSFWF